jgi:transcriptional regulator with XRE-family HTH domain
MNEILKIDDEKVIKSLNKVGDRIKWCRQTLGLLKYKVAKDTGINQSTYSDRENGMRALQHEEYLVLALYFNDLWKKKFQKNCALYEGTEIYKIKVSWLMFGIDE